MTDVPIAWRRRRVVTQAEREPIDKTRDLAIRRVVADIHQAVDTLNAAADRALREVNERGEHHA